MIPGGIQQDFWEFGPATLFTSDVAGNNFCPGMTISIPFVAITTFNTGNVFTAQLSNASGSFANPVAIGTLTSSLSAGTIIGMIPAGTLPGTGYRVRVVSSSPLTLGTANNSNLSINAATPVSVSITTPANPVCNGLPVTFTALPVNPGATPLYQWKVNGSNMGTNSPAFTYTPGHKDTVRVHLASSTTCPVPSPAVSNAVVMSLILGRLAVTPAVSFMCQGDSVKLYADTTVTGATYLWQQGSSNIPAATGNYYIATTAGTYKVTVTKNSCTGTTPPVTVIQYPLPLPMIQYVGSGVMSTGTYTSYQWYLNGIAIPGANGQSYTTIQNGNYTVTVTDFNGCTGTSAVRVVDGVGIANFKGRSAGFSLYPNPAKGMVRVSLDPRWNDQATITIELFDGTGRLVSRLYEGTAGKLRWNGELHLPEAAAGLYSVVLSCSGLPRQVCLLHIQ